MEIVMDKHGTADGAQGLSRYELMRSADLPTMEQYAAILQQAHGALSYNADNDAVTKFRIALNSFVFSEAQFHSLNKLGLKLCEIEKAIDPARLRFEIGLTSDDEVYISRSSGYGVNNILIYEDGSMAHSFIGYKSSGKPDFLYFLEPADTIDHESLLLRFFSYR